MRDIISDIVDELSIGDAIDCWEDIFDGSDFLCGEEDSGCIEKEIEGMIG